MKRISLFFLLSFSTLGALFARTGVDFHFGIGYGGDVTRRKQAFSNDLYTSTDYVHIVDAFTGFGYKFMDLVGVEVSTGLDFQLNWRLIADLSTGSLSNAQASLGSDLDLYGNAYLKASWRAIPALPVTGMATFGVGFRQAHGFANINASNVILTALEPKSKNDFVVGYKMGLRAYISFLFIGVDYTAFVNPYQFSNNTNVVQTISFTGGLGWSI